MAAPKEGGFKMSLGKLKVKPGLKASPLEKGGKKARLALGDDEPEDTNKQQEILGWDAAEGGALEVNGKTEKEGPRIIPAQPNRDWRAEARRKLLAKAPHNEQQKAVVEDKVGESKIKHGLNIIEREEPEQGASEAPEPVNNEADNLTDAQRLDKKALDALLSGKSVDEDLIIPVQTEEEAFQYDLHNAPEAPTLEAYEAQPIEGFGAALLRGMGWKDGQSLGKGGVEPKQKEIKRRSALLGIGAKEEAAVGIELGAWGGKGKGKKVNQVYNPVALRNKHTGEIITEEELNAKLESQDLVQEEKPSKERRKYSDDDREDKRSREKRRDKDRDRRRDDDYADERSRDKARDRRRDRDDYDDSDRRREKRRDREDDYESERRRDKRRDRYEDEDSERRKDKRRERSRSADDRKEKRRDRYRSRSRDTEDKRDRRKDRDRKERSRSPESDERRKRRRDREYEYDDGREERKRRH